MLQPRSGGAIPFARGAVGGKAATMAKPGLHIPSLDGLRAISFSIVFIAHAGLERVVPGGFGVTVFLFLSGFLITTLMRIEFDETDRIFTAPRRKATQDYITGRFG